MNNRKLLQGINILAISFVLTACQPSDQSTGEMKISTCVDNLRNIYFIKMDWAAYESKGSNDVPSWEDLRPFFLPRWSNNIPLCPAGGSYQLNSVGMFPTCSIGGPGHQMKYENGLEQAK